MAWPFSKKMENQEGDGGNQRTLEQTGEEIMEEHDKPVEQVEPDKSFEYACEDDLEQGVATLTSLLGKSEEALKELPERERKLQNRFLNFYVQHSPSRIKHKEATMLLQVLRSKRQDRIDMFLQKLRNLGSGTPRSNVFDEAYKAADEADRQRMQQILGLKTLIEEPGLTRDAEYRNRLRETTVRLIRRHYSSNCEEKDKSDMLELLQMIENTNYTEFFRKFTKMAEEKCQEPDNSARKRSHNCAPLICSNLLPEAYEAFVQTGAAQVDDSIQTGPAEADEMESIQKHLRDLADVDFPPNPPPVKAPVEQAGPTSDFPHQEGKSHGKKRHEGHKPGDAPQRRMLDRAAKVKNANVVEPVWEPGGSQRHNSGQYQVDPTSKTMIDENAIDPSQESDAMELDKEMAASPGVPVTGSSNGISDELRRRPERPSRKRRHPIDDEPSQEDPETVQEARKQSRKRHRAGGDAQASQQKKKPSESRHVLIKKVIKEKKPVTTFAQKESTAARVTRSRYWEQKHKQQSEWEEASARIKVEAQKYQNLSKAMNKHLIGATIGILTGSKATEGTVSTHTMAKIPENLLESISINLGLAEIPGYYMAASLLVWQKNIDKSDLPDSAQTILDPLFKLLDEKSYKPCIHPDFRCKNAQCFEQWYVLCCREQPMMSFESFKLRHWDAKKKKYGEDFKNELLTMARKFSESMIMLHHLTSTLCAIECREALTEAAPLDADCEMEGLQTGGSQQHGASGSLKRPRKTTGQKAAKAALDEGKKDLPNYLSQLHDRVVELEAEKRELKADVDIKAGEISMLKQDQAAWLIERTGLMEDQTTLKNEHTQKIQKLKDEQEAQGQVKEEKIRNLNHQLDTQKERNKEEKKRHKSEKEALDSAVEASKVELMQHQTRSQISTNELTEEKNNAQSNLTKQTAILNTFALAVLSYVDIRMKWVKKENSGDLQTQVELLRKEIDNKDNPDYAAIYKSWDMLDRSRDLPSIEARLSEVKDEIRVEHVKASKGAVDVIRQCLVSVGRASEEVETSVDEEGIDPTIMVNSLKAAGLHSKPVLEHMKRLFPATFLAQLNSDTTKAEDAMDVYKIYEPIFPLLDRMWKNKDVLQNRLNEIAKEYGKCQGTLQSLQDSMDAVNLQRDHAIAKHRECEETLHCLQAAEKQLRNDQEKKEKLTNELKLEKHSAQSSLKNHTAILDNWGPVLLSYLETRITWTKGPELQKLNIEIGLLRAQLENKDNPDYAAIFELWNKIHTNKNLASIDAELNQLKDEFERKSDELKTEITGHVEARAGGLEVIRQCLVSINRDEAESKKMKTSVDQEKEDRINMIKGLQSAGLLSEPVIADMKPYLPKGFQEELSSKLTPDANAMKVYDIYSPTFKAMGLIWQRRETLQAEYGRCKDGLKSLERSENATRDDLGKCEKEIATCKETLRSQQRTEAVSQGELKDLKKKLAVCKETLQNIEKSEKDAKKNLEEIKTEHDRCKGLLQISQTSEANTQERLNQVEKDHAATRQSLMETENNIITLKTQWSQAVELMEALFELYTESNSTSETVSESSPKTPHKPSGKMLESIYVHAAEEKAIKGVGDYSDKRLDTRRSRDPQQRVKECMSKGNLADQRILEHWHCKQCGCDGFKIQDGKVSTTALCELNGVPLELSGRSAASDACWSMLQWIDAIAKTSKTFKDSVASGELVIKQLKPKNIDQDVAAEEDLAKKTQQYRTLERDRDAIAEHISLLKFVESIPNSSDSSIIVPKCLKGGTCVNQHVIKCLHTLLCGCDLVLTAVSEATYTVTQYEKCLSAFKDVLPKTIVAEANAEYEVFYSFLSAKARCCMLDAKCSELEATQQKNNVLLKEARADRAKSKNVAHLYQKASLYCAQLTVEPLNEKEFARPGDEGPARREARKSNFRQVWLSLTTSVEETEKSNDEKLLELTKKYSDAMSMDTNRIFSQLVCEEEIDKMAATLAELEGLRDSDANKMKQNTELQATINKHKSIVRFVVSVQDRALNSDAALEPGSKTGDWADREVVEDLHTILCKRECTRDFAKVTKLNYTPTNYPNCSEDFGKALPEKIVDKIDEEYKPYGKFLSATAKRCELALELEKTSRSNAACGTQIEDLEKDLRAQRAKAIGVVHSYQKLLLDFAHLVASTEYKNRHSELEKVRLWLEVLLTANEDDKLKAPIDIYMEPKSTLTTEQVFLLLGRAQDVTIFEQKVLRLETQLQSKKAEHKNVSSVLNGLISSWTQLHPRKEDWAAEEIIRCIIAKEEHQRLTAVTEEVTARNKTAEVQKEVDYDQIVTEKEAISRRLQNVEARHTLVCETLRTLSGSPGSFQKFTSCLESGYIGTEENIVTLHMILSKSANVELTGNESVKDCQDADCPGNFLHKFPMQSSIDGKGDISDELVLLRQVKVFWVSKRHLEKSVSSILSWHNTQLLQRPKEGLLSASEFVSDVKLDCMLSVMEYVTQDADGEGQAGEEQTNRVNAEAAIQKEAEFVGLDWNVISTCLNRKKYAAQKQLSDQNKTLKKGRGEKEHEHEAAKDIKTRVLRRCEILVERITAKQSRFEATEEKNVRFNLELETLREVYTRSRWMEGQLPRNEETRMDGENGTVDPLASVSEFVRDVVQQAQNVEDSYDEQYAELKSEAQINDELSSILTEANWPLENGKLIRRILKKKDALQHITSLRLIMALEDVNADGARDESRIDTKSLVELAKMDGVYHKGTTGYLRTVLAKNEEAQGMKSKRSGPVVSNEFQLAYGPFVRLVLSSRIKGAKVESQLAACSSKIMDLYTQCGGRSGAENQPATASGGITEDKYQPLISQLDVVIKWVANRPSQKQVKPEIKFAGLGHYASAADLQAALTKNADDRAMFKEMEPLIAKSEEQLGERYKCLEPGIPEKVKAKTEWPSTSGSLPKRVEAQLTQSYTVGYMEGFRDERQLEVERADCVMMFRSLGPGVGVVDMSMVQEVRRIAEEVGLYTQELVEILPVLAEKDPVQRPNEVFTVYERVIKAVLTEAMVPLRSVHGENSVDLISAGDSEMSTDVATRNRMPPVLLNSEEPEHQLSNCETLEPDVQKLLSQPRIVDWLWSLYPHGDVEISKPAFAAKIQHRLENSEQPQRIAPQVDLELRSSSSQVNMSLTIHGQQFTIFGIWPGNGGNYAFEVHDDKTNPRPDMTSLGKILKKGSVDEVTANRDRIYTLFENASENPRVRLRKKEMEYLPGMVRFKGIKYRTERAPEKWMVEYKAGANESVYVGTIWSWGEDVRDMVRKKRKEGKQH